MNKLAAIFLLAACLPAAAADIGGTGRYFDPGTDNFFSLNVSSDTGGNVLMETKGYQYVLSQDERGELRRVVGEGLRLIGIAVSNKTTIDYQREIGRLFFSRANMLVYAGFRTRGWQDSVLVLQIISSGRNVVMEMDQKQAQELAANLDRVTDQNGEHLRQLRLFDPSTGEVASGSNTARKAN
jgi:hypothetical protein